MKYLAFLLISLLATQGVFAAFDIEKEWRDFKRKYKNATKYRSVTEENDRFEIFRSNLNFIEQHNIAANDGKYTFRLGVNQYADLTEEEFQSTLLATINLTEASFPQNIHQEYKFRGRVPYEIDWTSKNKVTPVKDQKKCGSCWAFSAAAAIESAWAIKFDELFTLSEQYLIDCDFGNRGCNGGSMLEAFDYVLENGIGLEEDFPYNAVEESCMYDGTQTTISIAGYSAVKQGSDFSLKLAVSQQPVCAGICATRYLMLYRSGVLNDPYCGNSIKFLNHAVVIVGYGKEEGLEYWLCKNSWGPSWGEKGFFKLSRNRKNHCGISTYASYPIM